MKHLVLLCCMTASACVVGYETANARSQGYYDMVRDDGTVVVTYRGNERTTLHNAKRFAVCRAAEVMASLHHKNFAIVDERVGDPDPATVTTCTYFLYSQCTVEHLSLPVVTLVVRPIESSQETKGFTYSSEETSPCRLAQAEAARP